MTLAPEPDADLIVSHTTAAAASVARWVARHHGLAVSQCHLIRRNLNDNYALQSSDGRRYVARLCAIRPRGAFNISFETALLAHLQALGAGVVSVVPATDGRASVPLQFHEGERALVLFEHAEGNVPESLEDHELTGAELARIHQCARSYAGPASRYTLDGHHLAGRCLQYLQTHPALDAELMAIYSGLVQRLLDELAAVEAGLTRVMCHGDTHGFNNHVVTDAAGAKRTRFFDFDDAGPGFLAYDLSVLPWSHLLRKGLKEPDDALRERWTHYVRAYRAAGGEVSDSDLAAIPLFLQLRHLWNLGEGVGRVHHWGANLFSVDWMRKQPDVFEAWSGLDMRI
jgi:Ser/Thr protein kinase RdoA (MazF antagonist)